MRFTANSFRNSAFSEPFLKRYRKQKLNFLSATHWLDEVGDYSGTQREKYVLESDSTAVINSSHITNQTVTSKKGTATATVSTGQIAVGSGWISEIVLSDGTVYFLEESSGTNFYDSSGAGNNATLTGSGTWAIKRDLTLINNANKHGYTLTGNVIIPVDLSDLALNAEGDALQFVGRVASDMKFVESNRGEVGVTSDYGQFNFDCTGVTVVSKEGQTTVNINQSNNRLIFTGIGNGSIYHIVLSNGLTFPIAEGLGVVSYAENDSTKTLRWFGNFDWSTQDTYHHNINEGFNDAPYFDGNTSAVVFDAWDLRSSTFRMKFIYDENAPEGQIISLHDNSNSSRILNATVNSTVGSNTDLVVQIRDFSPNNIASASWNGLVTGKVYELIVTLNNTADDFTTKTLNGVTSTLTGGDSRGVGSQTANTFYLGIRIGGGFPFKGIIFSCEAVGLHKWNGINNWIDSIGNNNGVVTNPLYVKLPFKIGGVYSNPAASYEEGIKLLGNSYGIVSSNIVTGDLLSQDYFDFTCTAAKSSLRQTGSAQVIFSYRNSQTDLVQFFLGSTTGATAQYRANDNVLYTINYADLDNTVFVKYRVYLDVLNKTFSLYVNDVLFETIDLVIDAQTLTSSIFSIGRIFSGTGTGTGKFYGIIKDISISTAANSANFELKETADLIAYDKDSISKTITFVTVDWLYRRIAAMGHNQAETKLKQVVFREDFGASSLHFDQSDLSSEVITYADIANTANVFVNQFPNVKINLETFSPAGIINQSNRQNNGLRRNKDTFFGNNK